MLRMLATICFVGIGCVSSGPWREVASPHFVLRTDLDGASARRAVVAMELSRDMVVSAAWGNVEIPEWARAEVYVLGDERDFADHFGERLTSATLPEFPPQYFLSGGAEGWESRTSLAVETTSFVRNHLAFEIAGLVYPESPHWFRTGIGEFLSTAHLSDDGRSVVMGAPNVAALERYRAHRSVSLVRMLAWGNGNEPVTDFSSDEYFALQGLSWVFVHWLINTQSDAFGRYRAELMRGTKEKDAFAAAFPRFDAEATERGLFQYARQGEYAEITVPLRTSQPALEERLLGPADLQVVRARLANASGKFGQRDPSKPAFKEEVRQHVDQALALAPTNVAALWMAEWRPAGERLSNARAAVQAHPQDPRSWELLAELLRKGKDDGPEQENALRKALALAPNNPDSLNNLAVLLLRQNKNSAALSLSVKAVKRAPYRTYVLETYAAAMFRAGNCATAVAAQRRAVDLMAADDRAGRARAEKIVGEYEGACQRGNRKN